jgi:hypothetical protein
MIDLLKELSELRGQTVSGIYLIQVGKHKYVGSSINIKKRLRAHRAALKNNRHDNNYMQNAFNKHKKATYKILEKTSSTLSTVELRILERSWVVTIEADLNLDDPVKGIGGSIKKKVYQYDMNGVFIQEWRSSVDAAIELKIPYHGIHSCANKNTITKSAYGFIWSYEKKDSIPYTNNTGSNLSKREIFVYDKKGRYLNRYDSLSDYARILAKELSYPYD